MKRLVDYKTSTPFPEMMRFDVTQYDYYQELLGGVLPSKWGYQRKQMDITELWILTKPFNITLYFDDGSEDWIDSKAGLVWDLASTPKKLRSIVDNDSFEVFIPAVFHDQAFGLHLYSFDESNEIFRQLIRLVAEKYRIRYMAMKQEIADNMDGGAGIKLLEKEWEVINEWVREAYHLAELYHFGVDTFIGKNIYDESDPVTHWNRNFVKKIEVKV